MRIKPLPAVRADLRRANKGRKPSSAPQVVESLPSQIVARNIRRREEPRVSFMQLLERRSRGLRR